MNIYLTSGTPDFMEKVVDKHAKEHIILLHGQANTVLLHESEKKSVFAVPRQFQVLDAKGQFEQRGYYVFHNISLTDESKEVFEQKWLSYSNVLKNNDALIAYRFLKPKKHDPYIIITQWAGPASYEVWTKTDIYKEQIAPLFDKTSTLVNDMFNAASHITTYQAPAREQA